MFTKNFLVDAVASLFSGLKVFVISMFWAALLSLTLFAPEWFFSRILDGYTPYWDVREMLVVYLLILFLINSYYKRLALVFAGYLFFLQLSAAIYYSYFGSFYGPSDVMLLFMDFEEVVSSAAGVLTFLALPLVIVSMAFYLFYKAYHKVHGALLRSRLCFVLLLVLIVAPAINAKMEGSSQRYEADSTSLALKNALYSVSYFIGNDLPKRLTGEYVINEYQPYTVERLTPPEKYHVVIVMGESLASTHMSLYGYERETTPFLDRLKSSRGFEYRAAVSAGVSTRVSVPMFFNVQYEPDNWTHISNKESNLFRMAKQSGFQTAFVTTQKMNGISSALSSSDIDHWRDFRDKQSCKKYDICLIPLMETLPVDWDSPMFLVLNQRSAHSPYRDNFPSNFAVYSKESSDDYKVFKVDGYDDAVRYVDKNLQDILFHLKSQTKLPVLLLFTADHGQKLGEDGRYGHNTLDITSAAVPFVFYGPDAPESVLKSVSSSPEVVSHYDIGKLIASFIGYTIHNPNEIEDQYYINGVDIMGRAGSISYRMSDLTSTTQSTVELVPLR